MRFIVGAMMLIFLIAGVALLWHTLQELRRKIRRLPYLVRVEGIVLRVEQKIMRSTSGSGGRTYSTVAHFPVIQFQTIAGETVFFQSEVGDAGASSGYYPGQEIPVLYDPAGHIPPMIHSRMGLWYGLIAQATAGLLFIGGGVLIWFAFGDQILGR